MPVPSGTGSEKPAADMQQIIEQVMIRNRYKSRQQPHHHTDKVEPRIHQLQLPNMPATNRFPILYFLKQPHGVSFLIYTPLQQFLPGEVLNPDTKKSAYTQLSH